MIAERFAELSLRERMGLIAAVGFILLAIAQQFVFAPAIRQIRVLDKRIEAARELQAKQRSLLAIQDTVVENYDKVRDRLGVSEDAATMNEALKERIDEMALASGVVLRARKHLPHESERFVVTYVVEVSEFEGDVESLIDLLQRIETADGLLRVEQLSVKSQPESDKVTGAMRITQVMARSGEIVEGGRQI
jgi:type II secretory pathway component PulM